MSHYIAKHLLHPFCSRAARPRQGLPPCKMTGVPQLAAGWWWFCHEQTIAGAKGPCQEFSFSRCKSLAFSVSNCAGKGMLVKYLLNFKVQWLIHNDAHQCPDKNCPHHQDCSSQSTEIQEVHARKARVSIFSILPWPSQLYYVHGWPRCGWPLQRLSAWFVWVDVPYAICCT